MMTTTRTLMTATAIAALGAGAAFAQGMDADGMMMDGSTVVFPQISMENPGYIVIHETDADGNPVVPASLAHTALTAGLNTDVSVLVPGGVMAGSTYMAMLHDETNGNDTYDFAEGTTDVDTPSIVDGGPVVLPFGSETMMDAVTDAMGDMMDDMMMSPMIDVAGATSDGSSVTFPMVSAEQDGYVVVHATNADGSPVVPDAIGHVMVTAGENADVTVDVDGTLTPGTYIAMLHVEDNGNTTYDFAEGMTDVDGPATADGAPVAVPFTVN